MLLNQQQHYTNIKEVSERPRGWSYACLESTIRYYLTHYGNHTKVKFNNFVTTENKVVNKVVY